MADTVPITTTTPGKTSGFLSGVSDFIGSVIDNSDGISKLISAFNPPKQSTSAPPAVDAYGRIPGQAGYGTAYPTTPGITATPATGATLAGMSLGVKIALGAGAAVLALIGLRLAFRK